MITILRWALNLNWSDKNIRKNKELTRRRLVLIVFFLFCSVFRLSCFRLGLSTLFFFRLVTLLKHGSSYEGRIILPRVSGRFELLRVRFILPRRQKRGGIIEDLRYLITLAVLNGAVTWLSSVSERFEFIEGSSYLGLKRRGLIEDLRHLITFFQFSLLNGAVHQLLWLFWLKQPRVPVTAWLSL